MGISCVSPCRKDILKRRAQLDTANRLSSPSPRQLRIASETSSRGVRPEGSEPVDSSGAERRGLWREFSLAVRCIVQDCHVLKQLRMAMPYSPGYLSVCRLSVARVSCRPIWPVLPFTTHQHPRLILPLPRAPFLACALTCSVTLSEREKAIKYMHQTHFSSSGKRILQNIKSCRKQYIMHMICSVIWPGRRRLSGRPGQVLTRRPGQVLSGPVWRPGQVLKNVTCHCSS